MIYDLILLIILIVFVVAGIRRGAAKTLLSLVALVASAVLSVALSRFLSQLIFDLFIRGALEDSINSVLANAVVGDVAQTAADIISALPAFILSAMTYFGMPEASFESFCAQSIAEKGEAASTAITDAVMPTVTGAISAVVGIILFIVLTVVLSKVAGIIAKVFRLPVIRIADSLLGGVLGLAEGVLTVFVAVVLLKMFIPLFSGNWTFLSAEYIESSYVFSAFYSGKLTDWIQQFTYNADKIVTL